MLLWAVFAIVILPMLALDLFVLHRNPHEIRVREALFWSSVWIALAFGFMGLVAVRRGSEVALEFLACYLIEESLSVDNLFVFLIIFSYFQVPRRYQHKALFWGIFGAVVMRAAFIMAGVVAIQRFQWLVYALGALLIFTGVKMGIERERKVEPEKNRILRLFRRFFPVCERYVDDRFFVRQQGRLMATPFFVVLLVIETTDIVFAIDSVPAALAISVDPFVVFTSNVFAILGLRSIYFALAGIMPMFRYLHYGLSAILVFTGLKMIVHHWWSVPIGLALSVIGGVLVLSIALSVLAARWSATRLGTAPVPPGHQKG
jgi:tellurite resistance protein TerC